MFFLNLIASSLIAHAVSDAIDFNKVYFTTHCRIYNHNGNMIKEFMGIECLFKDNGDLISIDAHKLVMLTSNYATLWMLPGFYHHQLNWTADKKNILAIGSKTIKLNGEDVRADLLQKVSIDGKVLGEIDSQEIFRQIGATRALSTNDWGGDPNLKVKFEISHFNSFYEIPKQNKKSAIAEITEGNFIANSTLYGAVILSADLKHALKRIQFPSSRDQTIHDVQVTSDGNLIYFNNEHVLTENSTGHYSSVEKMDPVNKKINFEFKSDPPEFFYWKYCGGIQDYNDQYYLISHMGNGYYLVDKTTKKIVATEIFSAIRAGPLAGAPTQRILAADLGEFLKHWR